MGQFLIKDIALLGVALILTGHMEAGTALGRLPSLQQVAEAAVFAASDRAGAMTGAVLNLTCGSIMN